MLKHDVRIWFNIGDVDSIPFFLAFRVLWKDVVANVSEEKSSIDVRWIFICVVKLVMDPMCLTEVMNAPLKIE